MTTVPIVALLLAHLFLPAHYDGPDSPLTDWFKSLTNQTGVPCCDIADGHRVEDVDWRVETDGSYSVRLSGQWQAVPAKAVIKDNKAGYAIVWVYGGLIECFCPGPGY